MELIGHELSHENEILFKCHFRHCQCGYKKASMLKSHLRKRHPEYWQEVGGLLDNSMKYVGDMLKPSAWSYDAIEKIK